MVRATGVREGAREATPRGVAAAAFEGFAEPVSPDPGPIVLALLISASHSSHRDIELLPAEATRPNRTRIDTHNLLPRQRGPALHRRAT